MWHKTSDQKPLSSGYYKMRFKANNGEELSTVVWYNRFFRVWFWKGPIFRAWRIVWWHDPEPFEWSDEKVEKPYDEFMSSLLS
jgi:hypothetical protein